MWTHFWDMHSGGGAKEDYEHIVIEAPESEACVIFYNRFGHNPDRVTCTCCGSDYAIDEYETLAEITDSKYVKNESLLVIHEKNILDEERVGNVPTQGYVWMGD